MITLITLISLCVISIAYFIICSILHHKQEKYSNVLIDVGFAIAWLYGLINLLSNNI